MGLKWNFEDFSAMSLPLGHPEGGGGCLCVCLGCGDKIPQTGRLAQQKFTVSHLGKLEVQKQGVVGIGSLESCEGRICSTSPSLAYR